TKVSTPDNKDDDEFCFSDPDCFFDGDDVIASEPPENANASVDSSSNNEDENGVDQLLTENIFDNSEDERIFNEAFDANASDYECDFEDVYDNDEDDSQ
ncbi:17674_t:CDS:2, partial [Acaulospora morrowiae]